MPFLLRIIIQSLLPGSSDSLQSVANTLMSNLQEKFSASSPDVFNLSERCPACQAETPLDDLRTARCPNGHVWCKLTHTVWGRDYFAVTDFFLTLTSALCNHFIHSVNDDGPQLCGLLSKGVLTTFPRHIGRSRRVTFLASASRAELVRRRASRSSSLLYLLRKSFRESCVAKLSGVHII